MVDESPVAPWLRTIADEHAQKRHASDSRCLGSVGLIDSTARLRGVRSVTRGEAVSLQRPVETRPDRLEGSHKHVELDVKVSVHGRFVSGGDTITVDAHGTGNTHLDSVAHMGIDEQWHDGIPAASSYTADDALLRWAQYGVATRAVVADIPSLRGVPWVTVDQPVTGEEIEAAIATTGLTFEPGDALLLYMGRDRFEEAGNTYPTGAIQGSRPGIGESGAQWIADHGVSVLCWDFHDARAGEDGSLEVHMLIWAIGLCLVDNSLLGPAVRTMAEAGVAGGLLSVPPLGIYRSTGCLVNPIVLY
ncbi:MAG: cyclase family protein [Nocardioides sp.]|uniref:cyclase family protein n=1 Tax=Nocardioides sp. TaxID=35761 RepID=UPI0039E5E2D5